MITQKIIHIINSLIRRGYWFNNVEFDGCRRLIAYKTFNSDVVNLGSTSAVHAFNYEGTGVKGGNWAMSRNPLAGDYAILRNYSSFFKKKGTIVIIPLCPFSALAGSYDYLDDRYYAILYPSTIPNYSYLHDKQVQTKWRKPLLCYPVVSLFSDFFHLIRIKNNMRSEDALRKDAEIKMNNWLHEFSIKDFSSSLSLINQDAIDDAAEYINKIIEYCHERGAKPVITIPPIYHTLGCKFTDEIESILISQLLSKVNDKSVDVLNHMHDARFSNDRGLFLDSFLLNENGAKLYTRQVLKEIGLI